MFRRVLPAVLFSVLCSVANADGTATEEDKNNRISLDPQDCRNTRNGANCTLILACIGNDGLWFQGHAVGWGEQGTLGGVISDGTSCTGTWTSNTWFGGGESRLQCDDGTSARVYYLSQDPVTGTVFGQGIDSNERRIKVWTGENVVEFLSQGRDAAELPCDVTIPIG